MNSKTDAAPATAGATLDASLLRIAGVVVLGTIMAILDTTIVNVAIRDLSREFSAPLATMQWVATGYMLALATVIPLTGWAADRFGTKRLYMASIGMFLVGSALSGAAWSAGSLIFFRVLQGLGGGMIMPAGTTILTHAAGPQRIGRVMGIVGVPMLLGPILGPILGGWLVDDVSWRWIFFVNLPIGAIALFLAQRVLERDKPHPHHTLDWPGLLLLSPGLATFVYGLSLTAAAGGLNSTTGVIAMALGLVLLAGFLLHARRRDGALIDIRMFRQRAVGAPAATIFLFGTAFFGVVFLMPLYFQVVRGESALHAGLLLAAQGFGAMIAMPVSAKLTDKVGARNIVVSGVTMVAVGLLSLSTIDGSTGLLQVELTLFLLGLGMGSTMMPAMSAALGSVERSAVARVNAGISVLQRVGGSIGTALLAIVLSHQLARAASAAGLHAGGEIPAGATGQPVPMMGAAFGHTFLWSFCIALAALAAALCIRRGKPAATRHAPMPGGSSD